MEASDRLAEPDWVLPSYGTRSLSNAYVSVYQYLVPPGDTVALWEGENWIVYAEDGASLGSAPGGNMSMPADGAHLFAEPTVLRNTSPDSVRLVVVERTANPLPDRLKDANPGTFLPDEAVQLSELGSDAVHVLAQGDAVLATLVRLPPGEVIPLHSGFSRVIYALSDYTVQRFGVQGFGGAGSDATVTRRRGDALWNTASNFAAENVAGTEAEALVVAYYE
jgi:hypothetical protein